MRYTLSELFETFFISLRKATFFKCAKCNEYTTTRQPSPLNPTPTLTQILTSRAQPLVCQLCNLCLQSLDLGAQRGVFLLESGYLDLSIGRRLRRRRRGNLRTTVKNIDSDLLPQRRWANVRAIPTINPNPDPGLNLDVEPFVLPNAQPVPASKTSILARNAALAVSLPKSVFRRRR